LNNGAGEKRLPCPRCGTRMEYWVEIEISDGSKRIRYYYKCPRCGYRLQDIVINVKKNGDSVVLEKEEHLPLRLSVKVGNTRGRQRREA